MPAVVHFTNPLLPPSSPPKKIRLSMSIPRQEIEVIRNNITENESPSVLTL